MNTKKIFLTVIIPQYNEFSNLKKGLLHEAFKYLSDVEFSYEVLIVDDGSTDGSLDYLEKNYSETGNLRIIRAKHAGKPMAIYNGLQHASGKHILFTDMDQSTPLQELDKLLPFVHKYQAVIGSRGSKRIAATLTRKIAGRIFSGFRKSFVLKNIDDTQCGFKLFESGMLKTVFPKLNAVKVNEAKVHGWSVSAFDVELLYLIERQGCQIKEVKVDWEDQDVSDTKNRKFFRESIDMIKQVLMIVINEAQGKYGDK